MLQVETHLCSDCFGRFGGAPFSFSPEGRPKIVNGLSDRGQVVPGSRRPFEGRGNGIGGRGTVAIYAGQKGSLPNIRELFTLR